MKKNNILKIVSEIFLWAMTLIILVPLYFVVINSLKSGPEVVGNLNMNLPQEFHFENYSTVLRGSNMLRTFGNSIIYSGFSTLLTSILAAMASFIIVRRENRLNSVIFNMFLVGMIAPANMVTSFWVMKTLGLINTYHGIIMIYSAMYLPFSIFLYRGFLSNLPKDLDEAAIVDGAGPLKMFFTIIFPLLKPITVTVLVLNFVSCWNDFLFPLYFTTESNKWGVVLILFQYIGQFVSNKELLFAAATLIIIPTIVVYFFGQKYIISGMTAGAVKG